MVMVVTNFHNVGQNVSVYLLHTGCFKVWGWL